MGTEDVNGCVEVVINEDRTVSCGLLLKGLVTPEQIGIRGEGCVLKQKQYIYNYYFEKTKHIIDGLR
jgi:hypothetical protein